jgi:hypothetical protein
MFEFTYLVFAAICKKAERHLREALRLEPIADAETTLAE